MLSNGSCFNLHLKGCFCCVFLRKGKLSIPVSQRALIDKCFLGELPREVKPGQLGADIINQLESTLGCINTAHIAKEKGLGDVHKFPGNLFILKLESHLSATSENEDKTSCTL